jgi:2-C-methyl-D-erythritol 4-phosphate cytidylyltransferase / 2-C-methyl-D-erythritol 2,4-cyclodiphosphate synthase
VNAGLEPQSREQPILAVVVAAGSSRRMGGRDKLAADLEGRSVLRWSVEALAAAGVTRIVIVTLEARVAEIAAETWLPDAVVAVVAGGERRQESVAAGVAALTELEAADAVSGAVADPVILVHDAARPLASPDLVRAVAAAAVVHGAAIPILPVTETLKRLDGDLIGTTVDRTDVVAAQTPQGLRLSLLERAYAAYPPGGPETWTDEASLLEACRIPVHAIPGEPTNLKVTVPLDLERASAFLDGGLVPGRPVSAVRSDPAFAARPDPATAGRVGLGIDGHPFGSGEPLVLGGLRIDGSPRLSGHSDGDAALHAVADALLGAAGLGDLGRMFPADSRTPIGVDSRVLLISVVERVRAAGWVPANVDLTIVAARPKLAALLPAMGEAIAAALGVEAAAVNVKASTGNLAGSEGAGRSISASAVAWLVPAGEVARPHAAPAASSASSAAAFSLSAPPVPDAPGLDQSPDGPLEPGLAPSPEADA